MLLWKGRSKLALESPNGGLEGQMTMVAVGTNVGSGWYLATDRWTQDEGMLEQAKNLWT